MTWSCAITRSAEDFFVFARCLDIVIPGRAPWREPGMAAGVGRRLTSAQHILVHLAAVEMEKRHRRVVAQGTGGEALFEFAQNIPGHGMQIGERLRSDLDPNQF